MIAITSANYEHDYQIKLKFNTGEEGVVDLSDLIEKYMLA
jgi:heme-binding NEAT domain protein